MKTTMKMFLSILLMMTLCTSGLACETVLPKDGTNALIFDDDVCLALVDDCHELAGMNDPHEKVSMLGIQYVEGLYVRGFSKHGMLRIACAIDIQYVGGEMVGLTKLSNVQVELAEQYVETVAEIVSRRMEGDLCARNIIASTLWMTGSHTAHIFFSAQKAKVKVGVVIFNGGKDTADLYMGDFDGDGDLELGFAAGWPDEPVKKKEPEKEPEKKPAKEPVKKTSSCEKAETKACVTIDIRVIVKACVSFVQACCRKGK